MNIETKDEQRIQSFRFDEAISNGRLRTLLGDVRNPPSGQLLDELCKHAMIGGVLNNAFFDHTSVVIALIAHKLDLVRRRLAG